MSNRFQFENHIHIAQQKIPFLMSIDSLNSYLSSELSRNLQVSDIRVVSPLSEKYPLLEKYFLSGNAFLINDVTFLMENKIKLQGGLAVNELDKKYSLYL